MAKNNPRQATLELARSIRDVFKGLSIQTRRKAWRAITSDRGDKEVKKLIVTPNRSLNTFQRLSFREWIDINEEDDWIVNPDQRADRALRRIRELDYDEYDDITDSQRKELKDRYDDLEQAKHAAEALWMDKRQYQRPAKAGEQTHIVERSGWLWDERYFIGWKSRVRNSFGTYKDAVKFPSKEAAEEVVARIEKEDGYNVYASPLED